MKISLMIGMCWLLGKAMVTSKLGTEFIIVNRTLPWRNASRLCDELGGQLPCLTSVEEIKEALIMMEQTYQSQVYIKGIRALGFGTSGEQCLNASEAVSLNFRGMRTVTNTDDPQAFLCTLPLSRPLPITTSAQVFISQRTTDFESKGCDAFCPKSPYDLDRAKAVIKAHQHPAWTAVTRIRRTGTVECVGNGQGTLLPLMMATAGGRMGPLKLALDHALVLHPTGELKSEVKSYEHNTLCEYTPPLRVHISPDQVLPYGNSVNVTCWADGPHVSLKLIQKSTGRLMVFGHGNITAQIHGVQENLGVYQCLIKSASFAVNFTMANSSSLTAIPSFYTSNVTHFIVDTYNKIYLNCSYYGYPRGILEVLKDGIPFAVNPVSLTKRIDIKKSVYWCGVKYKGKADKDEVKIKFTQITGGRWTKTLGEVVLQRNRSILMSCKVNNVAVFEFYINNTRAEKIKGVEVGLDYIYVDDPNTEHVGAVYCQLPGTLKRNYGAIISRPTVRLSKIINAVVNTNITVWCDVVAHPKARVTWYTVEREVSKTNPLVLTTTYNLNNTNIICEGVNSFGMDRTRATLVLNDLIITNDKTLIEVDEFDDVEVECEAVGMTPITYEWRTEHTRLSKTKAVQMVNVTRDSPDIIICAACSPLSCKKKEFRIYVRGKPKKLKPPFVGKLNRTHLLIDWEFRPNVTYNFYFLEGSQEPRIFAGLKGNSTAIRRRKGLKDVRLGVSATNSYGTSVIAYTWPPFNVFIPAPKDLRYTDIGATFVDLVWGETECDRYEITVAGKEKNTTIMTTKLTARIRGLTGWSQYKIVVIPKVGRRSGPSSNYIILRTYAQKLKNPVNGLAAEMYEKTEVFLSWDPPVMAAYNGLLEGFEVRTTRLSSTTDVDYIPDQRKHHSYRDKRQALQTVFLSYAARSFLKRDLDSKEKYGFTVVAVATAGAGPPSNVSIDTKYDKNVIPENVRAWFADTDTINVSWDPLPGMKYNVRWWKISSEPRNVTTGEGQGEVTVPFNKDGSTITHVLAQVGKEVHGRVYNYSLPVHVLPHSLISFSVAPLNSSAVVVTWDVNAGFDEALLTVEPVVLGLTPDTLQIYDNVEMAVTGGQGKAIIEIHRPYILYRTVVSATFYGMTRSENVTWYLRQGSMLDVFWVRYALVVVTCAIGLLMLAACTAVRVRVIDHHKAEDASLRVAMLQTTSTVHL